MIMSWRQKVLFKALSFFRTSSPSYLAVAFGCFFLVVHEVGSQTEVVTVFITILNLTNFISIHILNNCPAKSRGISSDA